LRLLYLDFEGIEKLSAEYDKDTKALREELFRICWYMRGGLALSEAFLLTPEDRESIAQLIAENLETTKNTQLPFF
jgi:predicted nuclease of restriction endonuclease-like RecB superfamily